MTGKEPPAYVKAEFGRRLQAELIKRGWNQSELARHAEKHLPEGKRFGRDNISNYINGKHYPGPLFMRAICKALRVEPEDLAPVQHVPRAGDSIPDFKMEDIGGGLVFVQINKRVSWAASRKIQDAIIEDMQARGEEF